MTFLMFWGTTCRPANTDPLAELQGTWYIQMSNFSMWLHGNKKYPAFTYTLAQKGNTQGLCDVVSYEKKGKRKELRGFDKPMNGKASRFVWRGKGLLSLFKSKWEIVYADKDWMLIHFSKTLVTAEGYDVVSRARQPNALQMADIRSKLLELGIPALSPVTQP